MRPATELAAATLLAAVMLVGCDLKPIKKADREIKSAEPARAGDEYLDKTAIRDETQSETTSAVDTALEWARKYAEASERHNKLLQENRTLRQQDQEHQKQLTELSGKLKRAEKELGEANSMLLEMRQELDKWKVDVLGFRDEMRRAQKVQLDAVAKILKLVGGEIEAPPETRSAEKPGGETGEKL